MKNWSLSLLLLLFVGSSLFAQLSKNSKWTGGLKDRYNVTLADGALKF